MKPFFFILVVFGLSACAENTGPNPEKVAETFLRAYFSADFPQVLPLCTEELQKDINQSYTFFSELPEEDQLRIRAELQDYSFKMEGCTLNPAKDSAKVLYRVSLRDSTDTPSGSLSLVKQEEGWKAYKIL